jgi:hypothetical protein
MSFYVGIALRHFPDDNSALFIKLSKAISAAYETETQKLF